MLPGKETYLHIRSLEEDISNKILAFFGVSHLFYKGAFAKLPAEQIED